MLVKNIQTSFKPLFLAVRPPLLGVFEINEKLGNFEGGVALVYRLIGVPIHKEQALPEHTGVLLRIREPNATFNNLSLDFYHRLVAHRLFYKNQLA